MPAAMDSQEATAQQTRRALRGSCHCGAVRYVVFVRLPHLVTSATGRREGQNLYRCNCTACHKLGLFHLRVASSPDDFMLLAPLDPLGAGGGGGGDEGALGDYTCGEHRLHFLYCRSCATRCFTFMGEGEVVEVDLGEAGVEGETVGVATTRVWRPRKEGWAEGRTAHGMYLSVNAYTVDDGQGFDLRELTEASKVGYLDQLDEVGEFRTDRPHVGGAY